MATYLLGVAVLFRNGMKICVNLRNLRIELPFLGSIVVLPVLIALVQTGDLCGQAIQAGIIVYDVVRH